MPPVLLPNLTPFCAADAWSVFAMEAHDASPANLWWWLGFGLLMLILLGTDLLALHRRKRDPSVRESAATVATWCLLAVAFNGVIWWWMGNRAGLQFSTGYLLEWSLSMDNVFVFAVIFRFFQVPKIHQYRILFWGILGAVILRLAFILAGAALILRFQFILPLFGLFLIYTAYHMAFHSSDRIDPKENFAYRFARRWLPLADDPASIDADENKAKDTNYGRRFLVRQDGRLKITAPLLVLLVVESTDVLFAVDSVPAIFGITRDPFIIFTSNVFAILGLRALYFLLAGVMERFRYLHYGLAAVLGFVGLKMVAEGWLAHEAGSEIMPAWGSLVVIGVFLGLAILASALAEVKNDTE
jgi:tellurite resistance protein TerC